LSNMMMNMAGCHIKYSLPDLEKNIFCEHETGQQFEADRYERKGKRDEYLDSNIDYRSLVSFTGIYPSKIGDFNMTEKKLSGGQR
jgi:hypothetical protein